MSTHPDYTFAHVGLNVDDMDAAARWYVKNLGLSVARRTEGVFTFLADPSGRVIIEFYANPDGPVQDFANTHFLSLHLAFLADDPEATAAKLIAAGATVADPYKVTPAGDRMVILRDPFGISIQFLHRAVAMF